MELNGLKKERRTDHLNQTNGDLALASVGAVDPWTAWAYKPRTISLLLIGACFLM
jgi:phosphatidylserine synthase 2